MQTNAELMVEHPAHVLEGHHSIVNNVEWNHAEPMLASAGVCTLYPLIQAEIQAEGGLHMCRALLTPDTLRVTPVPPPAAALPRVLFSSSRLHLSPGFS